MPWRAPLATFVWPRGRRDDTVAPLSLPAELPVAREPAPTRNGSPREHSPMPVPAALLPALRCPRCRSTLDGAEGVYRCEAPLCARRYPVLDGVPVFLEPRTSLFAERSDDARLGAEPPRRGLRTRLSSLLPELCVNPPARKALARVGRHLRARSERPKVLVIGGRVRGRGTAQLLEATEFTSLETDIVPGPHAELLCDAHALPFETGTFDGVLVQAVLEHVLDPVRCVSEIHRVLAPGGLVYADTPFIQQVHDGAYDFTRFTATGHRRLFRMFEELESGASVGPGSALAWTWAYFLRSFSDRRVLRGALFAFGRVSGFWLKYFDYLLLRRKSAVDAAGGVYFIGTPREEPLPDEAVLAGYRGGFAAPQRPPVE